MITLSLPPSVTLSLPASLPPSPSSSPSLPPSPSLSLPPFLSSQCLWRVLSTSLQQLGLPWKEMNRRTRGSCTPSKISPLTTSAPHPSAHSHAHCPDQLSGESTPMSSGHSHGYVAFAVVVHRLSSNATRANELHWQHISQQF